MYSNCLPMMGKANPKEENLAKSVIAVAVAKSS